MDDRNRDRDRLRRPPHIAYRPGRELALRFCCRPPGKRAMMLCPGPASPDDFLSREMRGLIDIVSRSPRLLGRALIKLYRYTFAALMGFHCRHLPTCSQYADEAIDRFGLWAGGWMTLARLLRCHPWGTSGLDLVPQALPEQSCWYLPWRYGRWRGTNSGPDIAAARNP